MSRKHLRLSAPTRVNSKTLFQGAQTVPHDMQGQLVGVAVRFLRNFGILSGASGVLGALSSGVASAALDDRFAVQRAQQKQVRHEPLQAVHVLPHYDAVMHLTRGR